MSDAPIWISETDVVACLDVGQAIEALEAGLAMRAAGSASVMPKTHVAWGDGDTLHAIGAVLEGEGYFGTKSWGHASGGATPLLLLWHMADGSLAAVIEAFALGQLRTGGISGLATRLLARPDADVMALIGTGKQAEAQVAAVTATRRLAELRVYSPTQAKREAFAERIADHGIKTRTCVSAEEAVDGASIITTATRARAPFLSAAMIAPSAHINAIGAITPEREELEQDILARACVIATDDPDAARRLSRELIRAGAEMEERITPLEQCLGAPPNRTAGRDLTLFKAMGTGLSDLSLGVRILAEARSAGLGRPIAAPRRAQPRLFPTPERIAS